MLPLNKSQFVVNVATTLRKAMVRIDENRHRSLIVTSGDRVVGTLSDGDARRALLDGHLLDTPVSTVMNTNFLALKQGEEGEAAALFAAGNVFLIPIVDGQNRLIDVLEKR